MKIGITIVATNAYFILGLRFIKRFLHFYNGSGKITFYIFTDENPIPYLQDFVNVEFIETHHKKWNEGTNSKFKNILSIEDKLKNEDYVFQFDADTNVDKPFTEDWFIGELVGGEHFANRQWMKETKGFDRNPKSKAYIPHNTTLPQMYFYGAFFGGSSEEMLRMCKILRENQISDEKIGYEPAVQDESYINHYFHYNPPSRIVPCDEFKFVISDKGGIGQTRNAKLSIEKLKKLAIENKDRVWDIVNNQFILE